MSYDKLKALEFAKWMAESQGYVLFGERVGVLRDEAEAMTKGGLFLPEQSKRKPSEGTVVMLGLGIEAETLAGLQIGDRVLFNVYNTTQMAMEDKDGNTVKVDVFHAMDIYVGIRSEAGKVEVLDNE